MRKTSTGMLEQGIQTPSAAPDLIPAESENLHWNWYSKRGTSFAVATEEEDTRQQSSLPYVGMSISRPLRSADR
jgi:hypothetical protein